MHPGAGVLVGILDEVRKRKQRDAVIGAVV
jgi:hypothetical protein